MALIVETGAIVPNANSYMSVAELRAYALARGVTLPVADDDVDILAIKATDYMETYAGQYVGARVSADQFLSWPRSGVTLNGFPVASTIIPPEVRRLQAQLVIEQHQYPSLFTISTGRAVKREKTGPLEKEYFSADGVGDLPTTPAIDALLAPLLSWNFGQLRTVRV